MKTLWSRVAGPFREYGAAGGSLYVLDRLLSSLSPRLRLYVYELIEQPIDGRPLLPSGLVKNLQYIEIGPEHPAVAEMPARTEIKASRFAQGARCLGAYRHGTLLGYVWFSPQRYLEDEVRCTFQLEPPARSVFDFDLYVLPEHRMGIAFMAVWHGANQFFHALGVRHSYSRITLFNLASLRAHVRLGGRRIGRAIFLRLWAIECMIATVPPFVGISWRPASRLVLRLAPASA